MLHWQAVFSKEKAQCEFNFLRRLPNMGMKSQRVIVQDTTVFQRRAPSWMVEFVGTGFFLVGYRLTVHSAQC